MVWLAGWAVIVGVWVATVATIVMPRGSAMLFRFVSVTVTVKLEAAAFVGVPDMTPVELKLRPAGKLPELTVQT
jgi:hypothetical protein